MFRLDNDENNSKTVTHTHTHTQNKTCEKKFKYISNYNFLK